MATAEASVAPRGPLAAYLWSARLLWLSASLAGASALPSGAHADLVRALTTVVWWLGAAGGFIALMAGGAPGLTVVRLVAPALPLTAAVFWVSGSTATTGAIAVTATSVAALLALSGEVAEAMVQAGAYGDERRFPLRTPAGVLIAAIVVWTVWYVVTAGAITLLCHRQWIAGGVAALASGALKVLVLSRMHRLSNRWLVLVPAGLVVRDPLVLGETLMVQRSNVSAVALALAGTGAADLTGPASGVAVEVGVKEMVTVLFPASAAHPQGRAIHVQSYLVCPTRPGRTLRALAQQGLPVG